jgi:two-component system response regulator HydG
VGSTIPIKIDVRLIAATNQNLEELVKQGKFRPDLFYRLNVIPIDIPALRERKSDIPLLANYFVKRYCDKLEVKEKTVSEQVMKVFLSYHWPGNVRELENAIERAVLLSHSEEISLAEILENIKNQEQIEFVQEAKPATATLEEIEKAYIFWVLNETNWQKSKAAQILGIDISTLYRKIEKYQFKEK